MMMKVIIIAVAIMAIGIAAEEFPADKPCTNEGAFDYYCNTCHCEKSGLGAACSRENCGNNFNEDGTFTEEYKEKRRQLHEKEEEKEKKEIEKPEDVEIPEEVDQKEFEQPENDSVLDLMKKGYKKVKKTGAYVAESVGSLWG